MNGGVLDHKKILIVDDELDVLETLEPLLPMCKVTKANTFDEAKDLLEAQHFDLAILDIMGVDGYRLLEMAGRRKVPAVMLTAHALSPEDTMKSFKEGAAFYIPKDKMADIVTYLNDVLEAVEKRRRTWTHWLERFAEYYDDKFGPGWRKADVEFWKQLGIWE